MAEDGSHTTKPQAAAEAGRRARISVFSHYLIPFAATMLLAVCFLFYYLTYVQQHREYLLNRNYRVLATLAKVRNLGFQCSVMADETYDLYIRNLPDDFYVSAVRVNGSDAMAMGLEGSLASGQDKPFEVILDSRGGRAAGRVFGPDGALWSGASMALIPDPPQGRLQAYRENSADEYGQFQIRGIPPGKYILVAWLDERPCDYYDHDGLDACRAVGMPVTVARAAQESVMLQMKLPRR